MQFKVYEKDPLFRYKKQNDPVYTDSCAEFFMQPLPGSDSRYLNFEFNAAGVLLLQMGETRENRTTLADSPAIFQIETALNRIDEHSGDTYWELAFAIPFKWMQSRFPGFGTESGRVFRGNFYKCGDETPLPHYGCWNRVDSASPDYHLSRFFWGVGVWVIEQKRMPE
ncbi:carbohydrate-binding family 9-like protein [Paenibacillus durus]|uniref:carbohydrate-binding family 9-like protein n=1 Tax=Paenibacillus durus TaxID=44251 RepID=UPI0009E09570|nr:carbohydrate-binding family 9-like protein [Paenibacillus durus]